MAHGAAALLDVPGVVVLSVVHVVVVSHVGIVAAAPHDAELQAGVCLVERCAAVADGVVVEQSYLETLADIDVEDALQRQVADVVGHAPALLCHPCVGRQPRHVAPPCHDRPVRADGVARCRRLQLSAEQRGIGVAHLVHDDRRRACLHLLHRLALALQPRAVAVLRVHEPCRLEERREKHVLVLVDLDDVGVARQRRDVALLVHRRHVLLDLVVDGVELPLRVVVLVARVPPYLSRPGEQVVESLIVERGVLRPLAVGHAEAAYAVLYLHVRRDDLAVDVLHLLVAEDVTQQHDAHRRVVVAEQQADAEHRLHGADDLADLLVGVVLAGGVCLVCRVISLVVGGSLQRCLVECHCPQQVVCPVLVLVHLHFLHRALY